MKFELKRKYIVNSIKTLEAGAVIDVTEEKYEWLEKNGYGEPEEKKEKKTKRSSKKEQ
tara:strand:- start:93 stop:266 length:174 start_codon:yes stop_codon:yes gene_type:complete